MKSQKESGSLKGYLGLGSEGMPFIASFSPSFVASKPSKPEPTGFSLKPTGFPEFPTGFSGKFYKFSEFSTGFSGKFYKFSEFSTGFPGKFYKFSEFPTGFSGKPVGNSEKPVGFTGKGAGLGLEGVKYSLPAIKLSSIAIGNSLNPAIYISRPLTMDKLNRTCTINQVPAF